MNTTWYIVKVMPGKERQLAEQFNTQISHGNINFISRFVCPLDKEFVVIRKKKVLREKVIYSGYLYFETESELNDKELKMVGTLPSIMAMFGDKTPKKMRDADVIRILKDESLEEHKEAKFGQFKDGEVVAITDGPFASFNGTISAIKGDRIDLNVKVFGRETSVTVGIENISKLY